MSSTSPATTDTPIACSLSADDLVGRRQEFDTLANTALIARDHVEGGVRVRFRWSDLTETKVHELVVKEQECCPFLDFAVQRHDPELWLEIRGPVEAQEIVDAFFAR